MEVQYEDVVFDVGFRANIIMEGKLLIEIKSLEQLEKVHHKTVLTYLKVSGIKRGLLINFKVNLIKEGIHRKITRSGMDLSPNLHNYKYENKTKVFKNGLSHLQWFE